MIQRVFDFFTNGIWNIRSGELPRMKAFFLTVVRVIVLTSRFFIKNKCSLRASALTFYTLLSIVPIAALIFGIAKGLGFEETLRRSIMDGLAGHEEVADKIITFSDHMLQNAKGGVVAGVGAILLIWTALKLLASVEGSFNAIWGVKQGRNFVRKVSDYLTMLIVCPLMMIVVMGASAYATVQVSGLVTSLPFPETLNHVVSLSSRIIPFLAAWLVFTFIYLFLPNTRVRLASGLLAGVFTGTLYLLIQWVYMFAQVLLTSYNAVYGSFAALPFFLIWLQATWIVVLLGAELAFSYQNVNIYELSPGDGPVCAEQKAVYSLRILRELALAFQEGRGALSDVHVSRKLEIPIRTTRSVLYELERCGLVSELMSAKNSDDLFQIALPVEQLTPVFVLTRLSRLGDSADSNCSSQGHDYGKLVEDLWSSASKSPQNLPLTELWK